MNQSPSPPRKLSNTAAIASWVTSPSKCPSSHGAADHERDHADRAGDRDRRRGGDHPAAAVGGDGNRPGEHHQAEERKDQPQEANALRGSHRGDREVALGQLDQARLEVLGDLLRGLGGDRLHRVDHERAGVGDVEDQRVAVAAEQLAVHPGRRVLEGVPERLARQHAADAGRQQGARVDQLVRAGLDHLVDDRVRDRRVDALVAQRRACVLGERVGVEHLLARVQRDPPTNSSTVPTTTSTSDATRLSRARGTSPRHRPGA
jgi:hypothetical protein